MLIYNVFFLRKGSLEECRQWWRMFTNLMNELYNKLQKKWCWKLGEKKGRESGHYSNVINDPPVCMCRTINHSQVKVTDRRFASWAANQMNFDNIDGIPLSSPTLIHFPRLLQDSGVALVIKLSPKFGEKGGGEANLSGEANLFHCRVINKN